ncbi:hypothetical protein [uncultured Tenacibaculum sp.]|uniref:hypothetical protein n=1 Tax=uncultured Tenacibaculum sp. TaxID=174713 RepID=UPI0026044592|nr:hypothetical protein [uncultured Tenacibaculum sp.]
MKMFKKITLVGLLLGASITQAQHVIQTVRGIDIRADTDAKGGNEGVVLYAANKKLAYFTPANNVHLMRTFFDKEVYFDGLTYFRKNVQINTNLNVSGTSTFSKIGLGITPTEGIHVKNKNIRVDTGEYQSWGPIILHPDVDNNGDDIISFRNSANGEMAKIHDGVLTINTGVFNNNISVNSAQIQEGTFGSVSYNSNGRLSLGHSTNEKITFLNGNNVEMASLRNGVLTLDSVVLNVGSFPDYVFSKNYRLMPLKEVATYIKEHKHLPNMPSEKEVVVNGMNLKQINTVLVEKVEELTLHSISQEEKIEQLQKELALIKEAIQSTKK